MIPCLTELTAAVFVDRFPLLRLNVMPHGIGKAVRASIAAIEVPGLDLDKIKMFRTEGPIRTFACLCVLALLGFLLEIGRIVSG